MKLFRKITLPTEHPFINNKYTYTYYAIINARQNGLLNPESYVEKHHIIPDCFFVDNRSKGKSPGWIPGNSNDASNIITCSAREHFVLHWLLTKMLEFRSPAWYKIMKAFAALARVSEGQYRLWTSGQYSKLKYASYLGQKSRPSPLKGKPSGRKGIKTGPMSEECKRKISLKNRGFNPNRGPKTPEAYAQSVERCRAMTARRIAEGKCRTDHSVSDYTRHKQSLAKKGKTCGENNNMWGKKHRTESIELMRKNRKPKVVKDEDCQYELIDPHGCKHITSNLFYFAQKHNLNSQELRRLSKPQNQHRRHKGWAVWRQ